MRHGFVDAPHKKQHLARAQQNRQHHVLYLSKIAKNFLVPAGRPLHQGQFAAQHSASIQPYALAQGLVSAIFFEFVGV